jgi:hypothetical protein
VVDDLVNEDHHRVRHMGLPRRMNLAGGKRGAVDPHLPATLVVGEICTCGGGGGVWAVPGPPDGGPPPPPAGGGARKEGLPWRPRRRDWGRATVSMPRQGMEPSIREERRHGIPCGHSLERGVRGSRCDSRGAVISREQRRRPCSTREQRRGRRRILRTQRRGAGERGRNDAG